MIRPDASQTDFAAGLNQLLAVSGKMLAVPAKKLAVFWLLLNNSQHPLKHLNSRRKFAQKIQHNSQQKIFLENSQEQPAFRRASRLVRVPRSPAAEQDIGSRRGAEALREYPYGPIARHKGFGPMLSSRESSPRLCASARTS